MAQKKQGMSALWDELKRTVGMLENTVETRTVDGYITLDELNVSAGLRKKLEEIDLNGDGRLTLEELQIALRNGLDPATAKLVTEAKDTVNKEIMSLYTEAMNKFTQFKGRLDVLESQGIYPARVAELQKRAVMVHDNIKNMLQVLKKKPEAMSLMRQQIRDFIRDVKALDPERRPES